MKKWNPFKKKILSQKGKEQMQLRFLTRGIAVSSVCLCSSLTLTFFPQLPQKAASGIRQGVSIVQSELERLGSSLAQTAGQYTTTTALAAESTIEITPLPPSKQGKTAESQAAPLPSEQEEEEDTRLDIVIEPVSEDGSVYNAVLSTALGPMIYYNQGDARWRDYLYGGADPMHTYGCGPTVTAMLVNSFSPQQVAVSPSDMADWAFEHGYYAPQGGSYRSLIPGALSSFGLTVTSVKDRSAANAAALLDSDHVLIALMGQGTFTDGGHFIIITQLFEDGTVSVADPNSMENSEKAWDLELIISELKKVSDSGAPLWAVSL